MQSSPAISNGDVAAVIAHHVATVPQAQRAELLAVIERSLTIATLANGGALIGARDASAVVSELMAEVRRQLAAIDSDRRRQMQ